MKMVPSSILEPARSATPGATNYVKKGPIRYVFVEVTSPPPSLDALNRQLAQKGRNGTTDILKGNTFSRI